jgi:hypothetical protein
VVRHRLLSRLADAHGQDAPTTRGLLWQLMMLDRSLIRLGVIT